MTKEEQEFLEWFYINADFGPAHEDVEDIMYSNYHEETGNPPPESYAPNYYLYQSEATPE